MTKWKTCKIEDITSGKGIGEQPMWLKVSAINADSYLAYRNEDDYIVFSLKENKIINKLNSFGSDTRSTAGIILKDREKIPYFGYEDLPPNIDLVDLRRIPKSQQEFILPYAPQRIIRPDSVCYTLSLPDNEAQFEKGLKKQLRKNLRSAENRIRKHVGDQALSFVHCKVDFHNWQEVIQRAREVSNKSWQGREGVSVFFREDRLNWLNAMLLAGFEQNVFFLYIADKPAAVRWTMSFWPNCLFYLVEYDNSLQYYRPGHLLAREAIRFYIREGFREIDFGVGDSEHKNEWGADVKPLVRIMVPLTSIGLLALYYQQLRWAGGEFYSFMSNRM